MADALPTPAAVLAALLSYAARGCLEPVTSPPPPVPLAGRRHSPDFCSVVWDGHYFEFTAGQAAVVALLWQCMDAGTHAMLQGAILTAVDSSQERLSELFRDHPAWGVLIVPGTIKGSFRLAPPAAPPDSDPE